MVHKVQAENSGQAQETTQGSTPAGDIAEAWFEKYSRPLTWPDLKRWLEDPDLTWSDLTNWLGEAG